MRILLILSWLAAPAAFAAPDPGTCVELIPGRSLGRFSLGTQLKEQGAVESSPRPGWMQPAHAAEKNIWLKFDAAQKLVAFEVPLPSCLTVSGKTLSISDIRILAAALGTCGPYQVNEGGNLIECGDMRLRVGGQGGLSPASVAMEPAPAPAQGCQRYLDTTAWYDAAGAHPIKGETRLEISEKTNLCAQQVLSTATTIAQIKAPGCQETTSRGGTQVRCGAWTYLFAGPKLSLAAVQIN